MTGFITADILFALV